MASIKSINLLPEIFRTDANKKFLAATVDQLISEPDFKRVDSFIGRTFAPTYKFGDSYIEEPDTDRQNYQLEPSFVVQDQSKNVSFYSSYIDLLQKIAYYGGITNDHSRLFENESYNFNGLFDFDKFVNFNQYYWLPDGPPEVAVSANAEIEVLDLNVTRDTKQTSYVFSGANTDPNPIITLVKGNVYRFNVNQPGNKFWIQTAPGKTGTRSTESERIAREVFGVTNNGDDVGTIVFSVPATDAQDSVRFAERVATVNFATTLPYAKVQSNLLTILRANGGIDGTYARSLDGCTLVFLNTSEDEQDWTDPGAFDYYSYDQDTPSIAGYEQGNLLDSTKRYDIFRIRVTSVGPTNGLVQLEHIQSVAIGEKIYISGGINYAGVEFIKNAEGEWDRVVNITAPLTELYYQDDTSDLYGGVFKLIEPSFAEINVETDILGRKNYTSPNGVKFTNGLKIRFDNTATPSVYANSVYIVEGVGKAIRLINVGNLLVPEEYALADKLATPDYITISRGSTDLNAWSRSNRWFHSQLIELAAVYNKDPNILLTSATRATRPIIEFESDLYLYDYGQTAKAPVDILDYTVTDAFKQVEGQENYTITLPNNVSRQLTAGTRIIFAADNNPDVRNRIYRVDYITTAERTQIHLVSQNTEILPTYQVNSVRIIDDTTVNFTGGNPDVPASAVLSVDTVTGSIQDITFSNVGLNYRSIPEVTFVGAGVGTGGEITVTVEDGRISNYEIISAGSGYSVAPVYGFIPKVTFSAPVPSIAAVQATGTAIMSPTSIANVVLSSNGLNYVADPFVKINTTFDETAKIDPVYSRYNYVDHIRITNRGTGVGTVSAATISSPNSLERQSTYANANVFTSNVLVVNSTTSLAAGQLVVAEGVTGGTRIASVISGTRLLLTSPAAIKNGRTYVFKSSAATSTSLRAITGNSAVYSTRLITFNSVLGLTIGDDIYGEGVPVGTTVENIFGNLVVLFSEITQVQNNKEFIFKPPSILNSTVRTTSRNSNIVTVDSTNTAGVGMYVSGGTTPLIIAALTIDNPVVITTTDAHNLIDGDPIVIRGVVGTTELNNNTYWIEVVDTFNIRLYADEARQVTLDGRNYSNYISGGVVAAYTIEYGVTVEALLDENRLLLSDPVNVRVGTTLTFVGRRATARVNTDSNEVYSIVVTDAGSGYTSAPSIAITYAGAEQPTAEVVLNDNTLEYFKVVYAGAGYQIGNEVTTEIISGVKLSTAIPTQYGATTLTFNNQEEVAYIKRDWLVFLVVTENQKISYRDFARVPYTSQDTTGPDIVNYQPYMDVELTAATVLKVVSVEEIINENSEVQYVVTLNGIIDSLDSDGEKITLPAGSEIFFTAKNRYFTSGSSGSDQPVEGDVKSGFIVRQPVSNAFTVPLEDVSGIQKGMLVRDLSNSVGAGIVVEAVDAVGREITVNKRINAAAGLPLEFSTLTVADAFLKSTKIQSIRIDNPGAEYTSAPVLTIEPAIPSVQKIASSTGDNRLLVPDLNGIIIGMTVVSEYNVDGNGVTTGAAVPKVVNTQAIQTGTATFEYYVILNQVQPSFDGLLVTFSYATKAISVIENIEQTEVITTDITPDTYEIDDTVVIALPTTGQSAIKQRQIGVNTFNQYYYTGSAWLPTQQKTQYNQAPLFDLFNDDGSSISDTTIYTGSKFFGTKIFSYKEGQGAKDSQLGFALSYKNFQNVGDIEFLNNFDNDSFAFIQNKSETSLPLNRFFLKQKNNGGFVFKNIWSKIVEKTKQYQVITKFFDGNTNYFEIDIAPESSETVPYVKVYVDNKLISESLFTIGTFEQVNVVIVDESVLSFDPLSKVDILIYSKSVSNLGYYQIPQNIEYNTANDNFTSLTLGQLRQHLVTMSQNSYGLQGTVLSTNNLRDLEIKNWAGSILQHASPAIYSGLALGDQGFEFVEAIELAQKEYTKFKNKFLDQALKLQININNIPESVDLILSTINLGKNTTMAWYDSDMVPYGNAFTKTIIPIVDIRQRRYQIPSLFNDTVPSRRSVLVYLKDDSLKQTKQLVKGFDFTFNQTISAIDLSADLALTYTQYIELIDRPSTVGSYVPETPTKLGLYPSAIPQILVDDTYQVPKQVVQGHDGSITPAFGDFRDDLLLELELRIFNNIKVKYTNTILDIIDSIPGKFRKINYTRAEFNQLLTRNFLRWVGVNAVDYTTNDTFQSNNAWTWNYKFLKDIDDETLPGFWRAIYFYYFDTDRPHIAPWEMLGFYEKPTWWEDRYGPAPYSGSNAVLWDDLELGFIANGERQGIDTRFARPGLKRYIPVDEFGQLKSPEKFAPAKFDSSRLASGWAVGDYGPVETAWRRSSEYPFALQIAIALSRPAFYFGTMSNTVEYVRNRQIDQVILSSTKQRITKDNFAVPDDGLISGSVNLTAGYVNWVRDWFTNKAVDGTAKIKNLVRNLDVKLSYKMAGYSDGNFLTVIADQSSPVSQASSIILPPENYKIFLNKSAPIEKIVYSAVVIERTTTGYSVRGYDLEQPYFTIIPSKINNNAFGITALEEGATIYRDFEATKVIVPYGFEFSSKQQVVDFLVSYGRYLIAQGFVFDTFNADLGARQDWVLSAREFLTWSQQGWKNGNLLILSPVFNSFKIINTSGVINYISNTVSGSKILDQNFNVIKNSQFSVLRDGNVFSLTSVFGHTIGLATLSLVQYEHVLLLDNNTVFGDIIYQPELGNRQYRLRLIGNKTNNWTGQLDPSGFIYNSDNIDEWQSGRNYKKGTLISFKEKFYYSIADVPAATEFDFTQWSVIDKDKIKTGLLPNFSYNAEKFNTVYNLDDSIADATIDELSTGITGFRQRSYFQDFKLDNVSQSKFYQGYIKQKGTINAVDALTTARFENLFSTIDLYEEWALRIGDYGALGSDKSIEFQLSEQNIKNNPTTLVLLNQNESNVEGFINVRPTDLYSTTEDQYTKNPIATRTDVKPRISDAITAGYPRLDDIDATIFDIRDYAIYDNLVADIGAGYKIWVAKDFNKSWNVYRANETDVLINQLQVGLDNRINIVCDRPHGLVAGTMIAIKNFDTDYNGFYQVQAVTGNQSFVVEGYKNLLRLKSQQIIEGVGILLSLSSVRFSRINQLVNLVPRHGWRDQDRIWIDNDTAPDIWAVYEKNAGWAFDNVLPLREGEAQTDQGYGETIAINNDQSLVLGGVKDYSAGGISGIRIISPGFLYQAPNATFSLPDLDNGKTVIAELRTETGTLLSARVTASGTNYNLLPNITIVDENTITVTANVYQSNTIPVASLTSSVNKTVSVDVVNSPFITLTNSNDIWVGDLVSGNDGAGNVLSAIAVANIIYSTNQIQLTSNVSWNVAGSQPISFVRRLVYLGDTVTGTDNSGNVIVEQTTVTAINILSSTIETGVRRNSFNAQQTIKFSRGTGGNVQARLFATSIQSIEVINGGSGFVNPPIIELVGGNGTGARVQVNLITTGAGTGSISSVTVLDGGAGYTLPPDVNLITTNVNSGAILRVKLTPSGVERLVVGSAGSGYRLPRLVFAAATGGTGSGATGNVNVTNQSVTTVVVREFGQGYTETPTITVTDGFGDGRGCVAQIIRSTGAVVAFQYTEGTFSQVQNVIPFGIDAAEFGSALDIGTNYAFIAAPASFNGKGAVLISKSTGTNWVPQQVLYNGDLEDSSRFGHSVICNDDESWLYVGAPGANKVFAYGRKATRNNQEKIPVVQNEFSYLTNFVLLKTTAELRVIGDSGKVFEPNFDYTLVAGVLTFRNFEVIQNEKFLYLTQLYPATLIVPTVIRGVLQTSYTLAVTPDAIEQLNVVGASGRVYIYGIDYNITGVTINFINNEFDQEASLVANVLDFYYVLSEILEPNDQITWASGVNGNSVSREELADTVNVYTDMTSGGFASNDLIKVLNTDGANNGSYQIYRKLAGGSFALVGTENRAVTRGVAKFGWSLALENEGYQLVVGAPEASVTINNETFVRAGKIYVFDREYQLFAGSVSGRDTTYRTLNSIADITKVSLNGIELTQDIDYFVGATDQTGISSIIVVDGGENYTTQPTVVISGGGGTGAVAEAVVNLSTGKVTAINIINSGSGYVTVPSILLTGGTSQPADVATAYAVIPEQVTVTFNSPPQSGAKIKVDVNQFSIVQTLENPEPVKDGLFGVSVALSADRKNIFVGAPGYRDIDYYNGKVYRYVNDPLTFGRLIGTKINVSVTQGDYIRINDIPVVFQEATNNTSKPVKDINNRNITGIFSRTDGVSSIEFLTEVVENEIVQLRGQGYFASNVAISFDPPDQIEDGIQATAGDITLFANGAINSYTITNPGSGYTFAPNVFITGGNTTVARAVSSIGNSQLAILANTGAKSQSINILPGSGTALDDLGIKIYTLTQEFQHPELGVPEKFGKLVRVDNQTGETLLVSSEGGVTLKNSSFDDSTTLFDKDTTRFIDILKNAGAVYIYDYLPIPGETKENPSQYLYNQVLQNSRILLNDNFGSGIEIRNNWIVVGASKSDFYNTDAGLVHLFKNLENKKGWSKLRERTDKVDIDFVNQAFLYNRQTQLIKTDLDYFDPAKGKILGVADQDLDYKTVYDPAVYNRGNRNDLSYDENSIWNDIHVGRTWWNLDSCRYIEYEQGDLNYRVNYWGELFPGSTVEVCEWVESFALPSEYAAQVGDGEAKYADNSAYVEFNFLDSQSGLIRTKYYYWVKNKISVNTVKTQRLNSVAALSNIIANPRNQSIPYISVVAPNAFNLYNVDEFVVAEDTIFKLEYATSLNENISHSEYELIQQNNPNSVIPEKYINKLIDSLSGENSVGEVVPDLRLKENIQLGISIRPRQTMVKDSAKAIEVFVNFVNRFLKQNLIVRYKNIAGLKTQEPIPANAAGFYNQVVDTIEQLNFIQTAELIDGYKVLVLADSDYEGFWTIYEYNSTADIVWKLDRIQSYDSNRYWSYADWYAEGYNDQTVINYIVQEAKDIVTLPAVPGEIIKVLDDGNGNFEIYLVNTDRSLLIIGVQNGTIQLNSSLYNADESFTGFDNAPFDNVGFAKTAAIEMRNIIRGLIDGVFTDTDKIQLNNTFFSLINYILSEQRSLDWLIKTSLLSVVHRIRKLEQFPSYIRDQQDYFESYINEVKPYRTQIRNYLLSYEGTDYVNGSVTDFDLPTIYDLDEKRYRTLDINNSIDANIIAATEAVSWASAYKYQIESIVVVDGGSGYFRAPKVTITGGGGTGATAVSTINNLTGQVIEIDIVNAGSGFTSQPTIEFSGGGGFGARAYAVLTSVGGDVTSTTRNKLVRNIKTVINFDRISYSTSVYKWKPYRSYHQGDILVIPDVTSVLFANLPDQFIPRYSYAYQVLKTILGSETINLNLFNDTSVVQKLSGSEVDNAIDRLAVYNQPGSPDIAVLYTSPDSQRLDPSNINDEAFGQNNEWNKVVHSLVVPYSHEYQYVAVGNRTLIAVSKTGEEWISIPTGENQLDLRDAAFFAGNTWVAVGNQATLVTSDDALVWTQEQVTEFKFSPDADNPTGLTQINATQVVDFVGVTAAETTRANYVIAVGNGNSILVNPYDTSRDVERNWYSAKPQPNIFPLSQQFLTVYSISFGNLQDIDGSRYTVDLQASGYFTEGTETVMKQGFVIVSGVNGNMFITSFNRLDDLVQGYVKTYNYDSGKVTDENYPWIPMLVPNEVRGQGDGVSGEQINGVAISTTFDQWIVAVGSQGTLIWNKLDSPIQEQTGTADLASDTIGKTVVDYGIYVFKNFRYFNADNFAFPLTQQALQDIDFTDIVWDNEKFVVTGTGSTTIWGFPGSQTEAYIELGNIDPTVVVTCSSNIAAGTALTFAGPNGQTKVLLVSRAATTGDSIVYVTGFDKVQSNWSVSGTGIPANTRVRQIGRFAQFTWQYAQGSGRNQLIDYNSISVNTTTVQINQEFTANIPAGSVITFFDSTGTKSQAVVSQRLNRNTTTLAFANTLPIGVGFTLEANTQLGITGGSFVTLNKQYSIGGVINHLAKDIPDLIPGTSYSGVKVSGQPYTETLTDITNLDTTISSEFTDTVLGTRPEDIIINGGKFIDTYSSHAPEELVPGQVIDSLQMNVFTANVTNGNIDYGNVIAYKIFTDYKLPTVYYRLSNANTTVLVSSLAYDDEEIIVDDISKLPEPNSIQNQPGSIWINAERINYFGRDIARNAITNIRRGASRTSIPMVHEAGSLIIDASTAQEIGRDTVLTITSDLAVNNGFEGDANTAIYRSAVTSSVPQGSIWLTLGT